MSTHEHEHDVAGYLLGELEPAHREAFERALAGDAALREEVERLRPVVAQLDALPAEAWEEGPEPPPLRLPADALPAPGGAPAPASQPAATARPRRRWLRAPLVLRPAFAAFAAAALLAGGIAIGVLVDTSGSDGPPAVQAQRTLPLDPLEEAPAAHGEALVADRDADEVTLQLGGLTESRPGEFYEAWLLRDDGQMISLGSFRVGADGRATVQLPLPVSPGSYQYFDVSIEREDEGPEHSGRSVLRGATSA